MKIYLFDPETGVYLGEDFADEALMKKGEYVIPPNATTIAPPEGGRGHILVFDVVAQCWEVRSHWDKENLKDVKQDRIYGINQGKAMTSVRSVLICDDEPIIRDSIKNKLKELGYDAIFECCDAMSAVSTACATHPDIAIIDAAMPKKDGLSAAREIRQKLKIPVILLMSFCDPETLIRAKKIGITTILTKPFRGQDLLPALEMAFAHAEDVELLKEHVEDLKKAIESQEIIDKAKEFLLQSQGLSEPEAYRKIQKLAMDKQKSMRQIAEAILITEGV